MICHRAARTLIRTPRIASLLAAALFTCIAPPIATRAGGPITFLVNSADDLGDLYLGDEVCASVVLTDLCTLRAALQEANYLAEHGETATIVVDIQPLTIEPATPLPTVVSNLDITGAGVGLTIVDYAGAAPAPVFEISAGHTIEIEDVTIQGGSRGGIMNRGSLALRFVQLTNNASADNGGGILSNEAGGSVSLYDTTVSNNISAGEGGGIFALGGSTVWIERSTLSGNSAAQGGGLALYGSGTIVNATLSGNSASESTGYGGTAVYFSGASASDELWVNNATIAGNTGLAAFAHVGAVGSMAWIYNSIFADNQSVNCAIVRGYGEAYDFDDDDSCLFGDTGVGGNALLLPFGNYGGPTQTRRPAPGSPVIDAGNPTGCTLDAVLITTDQRGWPRPLDGDHNGIARCDVGAVEVGWDAFLPLVLRNFP